MERLVIRLPAAFKYIVAELSDCTGAGSRCNKLGRN